MESDTFDGIDLGDSFSITTDDYDTTDYYSGDTIDWGSYESTTGTTDSSFEDGAIAGILGTGFVIYMVFMFAVLIVMIIAMWKIFKKAGRNGWESIIPIYSNWVMFEIVGMKGWYALLALIPVVGGLIACVLSIVAIIKLAKCFGKSGGFAAGLILLPIVFWPILGFGSAQYQGIDGGTNNYTGYNPQGPTPNYGGPTQNPTPTPMMGPAPAEDPMQMSGPAPGTNQVPTMGTGNIPQQNNNQTLDPPTGNSNM